MGGTKTPTYEMGKQFITDNGLDVSLTPYSSSLSPYAGKAGFETGVPVVATGAAAESVFARPECDDATDCATKAFGCVGPGPERTGRSSISSASPAMPSLPLLRALRRPRRPSAGGGAATQRLSIRRRGEEVFSEGFLWGGEEDFSEGFLWREMRISVRGFYGERGGFQ